MRVGVNCECKSVGSLGCTRSSFSPRGNVGVGPLLQEQQCHGAELQLGGHGQGSHLWGHGQGSHLGPGGHQSRVKSHLCEDVSLAILDLADPVRSSPHLRPPLLQGLQVPLGHRGLEQDS